MSNFIQTLRSNGITVNGSHHTRSVKSVYKLNYVWKIDNYSYHHEKKSKLNTPVFVVDTNHNCKWYLSMECISAVQDKDVMGIFLCLDISSKCEKVFVNFRFCIIDEKFDEVEERKNKTTREFVRGSSMWGFCKYISRDDLSDLNLFPNDELTIYCEATFSESEDSLKTTNEFDANPIQQQPDRHQRCVSKDFGDLFKNQKFTDFTISVNGKDFRAHKCILAARSAVFAAMFEHNTKENENNFVEIIDIDENVVEEMLRYIYTDTCENMKDLASGLLAASDKYDLEELKLICQETLISGLTVQNAAETLNLAHLHCATELKSKAINFVAANSVEIINSADWKKVSSLYPPSLVLEIFEALSQQVAVSRN